MRREIKEAGNRSESDVTWRMKDTRLERIWKGLPDLTCYSKAGCEGEKNSGRLSSRMISRRERSRAPVAVLYLIWEIPTIQEPCGIRVAALSGNVIGR